MNKNSVFFEQIKEIPEFVKVGKSSLDEYQENNQILNKIKNGVILEERNTVSLKIPSPEKKQQVLKEDIMQESASTEQLLKPDDQHLNPFDSMRQSGSTLQNNNKAASKSYSGGNKSPNSSAVLSNKSKIIDPDDDDYARPKTMAGMGGLRSQTSSSQEKKGLERPKTTSVPTNKKIEDPVASLISNNNRTLTTLTSSI